MATLLLSAAGAAIGAGFGGTVLGLSGAVIGRAVGATLGRAIDQRIMGAGSQAVEVGRIDRFRLMGASEGSAIPLVWGRTRLAGQVIWATQFKESVTTTGGKGAPKPKVREFGYSVSLAIAVCEGEISRIGRIWADGQEIEKDQLMLRVYAGSEAQLPDPKIAAVEGVDHAPAYRGTAYVVIEDLDLSRFGNRVPQFNFEVMRRAKSEGVAQADLAASIP
ncbi:MAG: baseplate multidomain protein megatron, partial [Paracoccaceae bacterium]